VRQFRVVEKQFTPGRDETVASRCEFGIRWRGRTGWIKDYNVGNFCAVYRVYRHMEFTITELYVTQLLQLQCLLCLWPCMVHRSYIYMRVHEAELNKKCLILLTAAIVTILSLIKNLLRTMLMSLVFFILYNLYYGAYNTSTSKPLT
jgi:hypothetical protein